MFSDLGEKGNGKYKGSMRQLWGYKNVPYLDYGGHVVWL